MTDENRLLRKYASVWPHLNERQRRLVAAADAQMLGYGGIASVARASGLNRSTLHRGLKDLAAPALPAERVRHEGGGRKRMREQHPEIVQELEQLALAGKRPRRVAPAWQYPVRWALRLVPGAR